MDRRLYLRHFLVLLTGTGAAQAANLLSYPFLARLYTPAEFGIFAMFIAASAIPAAVACGRYDLAVPIAPSWGRQAILWLCLTISAAVGTISVIGGALYWWASGQAPEPLVPWLLGLAVFLTGVSTAQSLYLMRHDRYRAASASLLVRTGGAVLAQILLGLAASTAMSLILGYLFGLAAQAVMLATVIARHVPVGRPHLARMRAMARRFRRQVMIDIPSTIIAAVSLNLTTFLLLVLYNERTVGFYSIGQRIAVVPLQLFNDALGQVFFQKAARAKERNGHFWPELKFNLMISGALSVAVLLGVLLLARPFIGLYLGKQWLPAADMLVVLAPMLAVRSLTMSVATAVFVLRRPQWLLFHNVASVLVTLAAFGIGRSAGLGALGFLELLAVLTAIEFALFALVMISAARRQAA